MRNHYPNSNDSESQQGEDTFPDKSIEDRVSNLELTCKHIITVVRDKQSIGVYECAQEGTLTQIKSDLQKGDNMIQSKFTELKAQIQELDNKIEERKAENGTQNKSLSDGQAAFDSIFTILGKFNTRISKIEGKINLITWFMGGTTGAIIFYVAYIVLKDFMNF